jgi:hypothetical protein
LYETEPVFFFVSVSGRLSFKIYFDQVPVSEALNHIFFSRTTRLVLGSISQQLKKIPVDSNINSAIFSVVLLRAFGAHDVDELSLILEIEQQMCVMKPA